jgi:hypothetical protein
MTDSVEKPEKRMKLFVAGQVSDNPLEWSDLLERKLFLAATEGDALKMTDANFVIEVRMDIPAAL